MTWFRLAQRTAVLTAAALLACACDIHAQTDSAEGSFDRTLQVTSPGDVTIITRSGSIRVVSGSSDQVRVAGRIRAYGSFRWLDGFSPEEQVRRLESAPPIEQDGNVVTIGHIDDWRLSNVSISYEVTVPADARIRTSSRSGDHDIQSVRGAVDASSRSGGIRLDDVRGPLRLDTRSGDVTVNGEPAGQWSIHTRSGEVALRVPSNAGFDVDVETRSGSIETSSGIQTEGTFGRRGFRGRVRGGGALVEIGTRSGSIRIE